MRLPTPLPGVIVQQTQDQAFLVDTDGGEVFSVNATAARLFALCQSGATLEEAVQAFAHAFEPGQEAEIREDLRQTASSFQELGLCAPDTDLQLSHAPAARIRGESGHFP